MAEQIIEELKLLADDLNIRSPAKLLQAAKKRDVRDATLKFAQQALARDVGRQIYAPQPRSLGNLQLKTRIPDYKPILSILAKTQNPRQGPIMQS